MTAWAIKQGLTVYSSHKLFPPAMNVLASSKDLKINGFIDPGHVSAIIGTKIFQQFKLPQVVTGFEPNDVLLAIKILLQMITDNKNQVINQYNRLVKKSGNTKANDLIYEVFEISNARWRGLGEIPNSGLKIKEKFRKQDAEYIYRDIIKKFQQNYTPRKSACICGEILQGIKKPIDCPLFKKKCSPTNPQGACMVSVEGTCRISYDHK